MQYHAWLLASQHITQCCLQPMTEDKPCILDLFDCLQVILALTTACCCLMVRVVFGLLAVQHPQYSNQPKLLYTVMVLPEMLALYIVAAPGLVPRIGWDCDHHMGIAPMGTSSFAAPGSVHNSKANENDTSELNPAAIDSLASSQIGNGKMESAEDVDLDQIKQTRRGSSMDQQLHFPGVHRGQSEMDESMLSSTPVAWNAAVPMS